MFHLQHVPLARIRAGEELVAARNATTNTGNRLVHQRKEVPSKVSCPIGSERAISVSTFDWFIDRRRRYLSFLGRRLAIRSSSSWFAYSFSRSRKSIHRGRVIGLSVVHIIELAAWISLLFLRLLEQNVLKMFRLGIARERFSVHLELLPVSNALILVVFFPLNFRRWANRLPRNHSRYADRVSVSICATTLKRSSRAHLQYRNSLPVNRG